MSTKLTIGIVAGSVIVGSGAYVLYSRNIRNRIARIAGATAPYTRDHAINKMVSQGRAFAKNYSSCGDLWNYVLDQIGAPNAWVNRDSIARGLKWKVAVNISQPWEQARKANARVTWKKGGPLPNKGDLVLIGDESLGEMAHVFVVLGRTGRTLKTAEYGGGNNRSSLGNRTIGEDGRILKDPFNRHIVGWINAEKIPRG